MSPVVYIGIEKHHGLAFWLCHGAVFKDREQVSLSKNLLLLGKVIFYFGPIVCLFKKMVRRAGSQDKHNDKAG